MADWNYTEFAEAYRVGVYREFEYGLSLDLSHNSWMVITGIVILGSIIGVLYALWVELLKRKTHVEVKKDVAY